MESRNNATAIIVSPDTKWGCTIANKLLSHGYHVVGVGPNLGQMELGAKRINRGYRDHFHMRKCDLNCELEIRSTIAWIKSQFDSAQLLIYLQPNLEAQRNASEENIKLFLKEASTHIMRNASSGHAVVSHKVWLMRYDDNSSENLAELILSHLNTV